MSGDYSSNSFDALRDFAGVFMQQGHPTLDADWNELVAILERRLRAGTVDTIGRAVVPLETPDGFRIQLAVGPGGPIIRIGRGRMYVHGLLAENHGIIGEGNPPIFDRTRRVGGREVGVLDELISRAAGDFVDYASQPYLPAPPDLPEEEGPHLVYLDVWKREVTPLKDPGLLEPALGGVDTATRWQTVWQVRVLPDVGPNVTCATPDDAIPGWPETIAPSAARLTNGTIEFEDPDEPCVIPPGGGYRGLENQLYRVEIHSGSNLDDARFKWSRENASVGAGVEEIQAPDRLIVRRLGRDSILRFSTGDWVEITDDIREFGGLSGDIRRVTVHEGSRTLELSSALSADLIPSGVGDDTLAARHTRVIRWDQNGQVSLADGTPWEDLDAIGSDGLIPVPADGSAVVLEAGVTVSFSMEPAGGALRPMDYWCFAARTAGAQIEPLVDAPPQGIHHHHARLAVVTFPATVLDCRIFWPPETGEGECCACTVCVTPESHNGGALTIQAAVDQLPEAGGTVCLEPGNYLLGASPVLIAGRRSVRLRGMGSSTVLAYNGPGGAIRSHNSIGTVIEGLAVVATPPTAPIGALPAFAASAIHLRNNFRAAIRRVVLLVFGGPQSQGRGVSLDGAQISVGIEDCLIVAPTAIGIQPDEPGQGGDQPGYLALAEVHVSDNLFGANRGLDFSGATLHVASVHVAKNLIFAGAGGAMHCTGAGNPNAPLIVESNAMAVSGEGDGVVVGIPDSRVQDNEILVSGRVASGVALVEGLIAEQILDAQVIANRISAGFGLRVEADLGALLVKRNVIRNCRVSAIAMTEDATAETLAIDNNVIEEVVETPVGGQLAAAVQIARVGDAQIVGNVVRGVARRTGNHSLAAGIAARGATRLRVLGNSFSEIGADESGPPSIAVLIEQPFSMIDVSNNQINGTHEPSNAQVPGWTAVSIVRQRRGVIGVFGSPRFFAAAGSVFALSSFRILTLGAPRATQVSIQGNQMLDAHDGAEPMVIVELATEASCLFVGNQCRLLTSGQARELVRIACRRIVAGNNVVRRVSDLDAMRLMVGEGGQATVIGNLTFGNIRLEPGGLPPEFQPLNLLSP